VRVLAVDDDDGVREGVVVSLRASGFAADGAADLAEARSLLAIHRYDCIVLDRMLPDGDGLALLSHGSGGKPPVLVLTARDAGWEIADAASDAADD
jgi:two-component system copper resistance phosphate regulon response regulator CusR